MTSPNRLERLTVADAPVGRQRELLDHLLAVENNLLAAVEELRSTD